MQPKGKNVLVAGADGFIGSHLVEPPVGLGGDVRSVVHYDSFNTCGWLDDSSDEVKRYQSRILPLPISPEITEQLRRVADVVRSSH